MSSTQQKGQRGEQVAVNYLRQREYTILATNWRCKQGEIDIIARKDSTLVFVEVRARATLEDAFASITPAKRQKMIRAVYVYLNQHHLDDCQWRVDVIAVTRGDSPSIDHVENALDW